ncbi:hypothetical protein [Methanococcoides sp. LMO-2]|uniref:Uncharacterized protein n=1 Tax=Methanococcoides cohabitans TaxID=3136559 RepID=A0ABU9KQ87_9EURY
MVPSGSFDPALENYMDVPATPLYGPLISATGATFAEGSSIAKDTTGELNEGFASLPVFRASTASWSPALSMHVSRVMVY